MYFKYVLRQFWSKTKFKKASFGQKPSLILSGRLSININTKKNRSTYIYSRLQIIIIQLSNYKSKLLPRISACWTLVLTLPPLGLQSIQKLQNTLVCINTPLNYHNGVLPILLIGLKKQLDKIHNSSLNTTHSARNLGFIFDEHFTFSDQISAISKAYSYHIRQLRCIRPYIDSITVGLASIT